MKIKFVTYFLLITALEITMAQENYYLNLYNNYENFKEESLTRKWFKHQDILPLISRLKKNKNFKVEKVGSSVEKRDINLISIGTGKTKILLWSQMHGDESTATMALFDIFNFLSSDDEYNSLRNNILSKTTLYFIPMLNPDGAERFQRRNAMSIDINRDAVSQQSPEAKILKSIRDSLNPEFGFNLHDQSTRMSAGNTYKTASISFLAPAYNFEKGMNETRERSVKVISYLNKMLSNFIPGHIAKYDDSFEPRAFGDNIQKWGTSAILIETGGWKDDDEKQFLRKLNFIAIISAFNSIGEESYKTEQLEEYFAIPNNEKCIFDLIIRNAKLRYDDTVFTADIGVNRYEEVEGDAIYYKGIIEDVGDLSVYFGFDEINCSGLDIEGGKFYSKPVINIEKIQQLNLPELYREGITSVLISGDSISSNFTKYPISVFQKKDENNEIQIGKAANLAISQSGKMKFVIINGFVNNLTSSVNKIKNGIIVK
ncbi:MAG: M14 family metallopeptidase [Ignavibacteriales bacterium]|nr:M14 family metallopeptidase [Ignavibacteriales bacterium]